MRSVALLTMIGMLLFQAGPAVDFTPWNQLENSLHCLGVQEIGYQGYCFLPENRWGGGEVDRWAARGSPPRWQSRLLVIDGGNALPKEGAVRVLQVAGDDHRACWKALQQQLYPGELLETPLVWMVEAQLSGDEADLARLAEELLSGFTGQLHSVYRDEGLINMVAYVPEFKPQLIMDGSPVNLNLELRFNPSQGTIRIRAGMPLLVSGLKA